MPAAVRSATAVEAAASAAELSTSVEVATATEAVAAVEVSAAIAAIESASVSAATVVAVSATVIAATIVAVASVSVITAIPGAGADEDAADEPVRSIEAVGCAGVRIIIVVAIGADGRGAVIGRGDNSDTEGEALGLRVRSGEETNSEKNAE